MQNISITLKVIAGIIIAEVLIALMYLGDALSQMPAQLVGTVLALVLPMLGALVFALFGIAFLHDRIRKIEESFDSSTRLIHAKLDRQNNAAAS